MRSKLHHLTRRNSQTWFAVQAVPAVLQPIVGKRHLLRCLHTTDAERAVRLRHDALKEFDRVLDEARHKLNGPPALPEPVLAEALKLKEQLTRFRAGDFQGFRASLPPGIEPMGVLEDLIEAGAERAAGIDHTPQQRAEDLDLAAARTFLDIVHSTATPLDHHVDSWLQEPGSKGPLTPRTQAQRRATVTMLGAWLKQHGQPVTIEAVTKAVAGEFITDSFIRSGIDPATANSRISKLSAYWRWLVKRAGVQENPWREQSLRKASHRNGKPKRAFTDAELLTLLNGPADQEAKDVIRIAALTGMRRSELFALQIQDCRNGLFDITGSKSEAGVRCFPQHSALVPIVARLSAGRKPTDFLIPRRGKRSDDTYGKWFTRYRRQLGVDDTMEGKRHSRNDFHSLRRWFATKARNAGIDRAVVANVIGHEAGNLTDDVYSAGPGMELKRACVEAVQLPCNE